MSIVDDFGDISEFEIPGRYNRILDVLKKKRINLTLNPKTGRYDVDGDIDLSNCELHTFGPIKFGVVTGDFDCSDNNLTDLDGAPQTVGGAFYCYDNQLVSLEGAPQEVGGDFYCHDNQLVSLEGAPQTVGGSFVCRGNQLI